MSLDLSLGSWRSRRAELARSTPLNADGSGRGPVSTKVSVQVDANNVSDRKFDVLDPHGNSCYGAPARWTVALRVAH